MEVNTQGTANLLQVLLDEKIPIEKLIVASSMSIYGEGQYQCEEHGTIAPPPRPIEQLKSKRWEVECPRCKRELRPAATSEEKPLQCTSIYALGKKDQEEMCLLYGRTYELPVVAYTGVAAIFASRLLNGNAPMIYEDARQMRDFVSVHDVVQANLLAMERSEADGMALNIGSGESITIEDVAKTLTRSLDLNVPVEITGKYRAGDIRHCFGDISLARKTLGYEPQYSFENGVSELVEWLRSQTAEDRVRDVQQQLTAFGLTA
jgi:dTDP-L-rhamnose 4-epimerase